MNDVIELYTLHAARYDRERTRELSEAHYLEAALRLIPHRGTVLDLGCGAGDPIARYFLDRGHRVVGVDAAPPMIEMCRNRFAGAEWVCADMRELQLNRSFDLIIAWDSFFHLSPHDQRGMFSVFEKHARKDSALLFSSGADEGEVVGDLFGDELYHASLCSAEYRQLLASHGYKVVLHRVEDPACGEHTVWLAKFAT